CGDYAMDYW
nr:immunoglobulin heavy chain junction region [Mus musculus]